MYLWIRHEDDKVAVGSPFICGLKIHSCWNIATGIFILAVGILNSGSVGIIEVRNRAASIVLAIQNFELHVNLHSLVAVLVNIVVDGYFFYCRRLRSRICCCGILCLDVRIFGPEQVAVAIKLKPVESGLIQASGFRSPAQKGHRITASRQNSISVAWSITRRGLIVPEHGSVRPEDLPMKGNGLWLICQAGIADFRNQISHLLVVKRTAIPS